MGSFFGLIRAFALEPLLWLFVFGVYAIHLGVSGEGSQLEVFYLQGAKEMLLTGQWSPLLFNHQTFYAYPPLFTWLVMGSMQLFGISLWAARLPAFLLGIGGIILGYRVALSLFNNRMTAIMVSALLASTWGYYQASHHATPETLAAVLFLASLWVFYTWFPLADRPKLFQSDKQYLSLLQGVLLGLLFLSVGWLGIGFPLLLYFLYIVGTGQVERLLGVAWREFLIGLLLVALPWPLWIASQAGQPILFFQYLANISLAPFEGSMGELANTLLGLLPWGLFLPAMAADYHNATRHISRQENPMSFLLAGAGLGFIFLVLFTGQTSMMPVFFLLPVVLLLGHYFSWVMEEGYQSKAFSLSTDGMVLLLVMVAVVSTFFIFQIMPDDYPGMLWQLPGPAVLTKIHLGKDIDLPNLFPVWKLWLLPGALILLFGGVVTYILTVLQRPHQVPVVLISTTLLFLLFLEAAFLPVIQRPLGVQFAKQINQQRQPGDAVLLVYDSEPAILETMFFLKPLPQGTVTLAPHVPQLNLRSIQPKQHQRLFGVISETDYYHLPPDVRLQLQIVSSEWKWHFSNPFGPSAQERGDTTAFREDVLLFESLSLPE